MFDTRLQILLRSARLAARALVTVVCLIAHISFAGAQGGPLAAPKAAYLTFEEALPTLQALLKDAPAELKSEDLDALPVNWARWIQSYDGGIRKRLAQGDEDSLVNLLFFGTTFTKQPRITEAQFTNLQKNSADKAVTAKLLHELLEVRLDDFLRALTLPSKEERIAFAQEFLAARTGKPVTTTEGKAAARALLASALARVVQEADAFKQVIDQARLLGDDNAIFVQRSQLYRNRGLSSDTSLRPNFAVEQGLKEVKAKGLMNPATVRRVAIIGPGLDFADKQSGYDFYPQQTIQPFAVVDSLARLGLSAPELQIVTLDLSPRVNDHIRRLRERGLKGEVYKIQLPLDTVEALRPEFLQYWESFGDKIGSSTDPVSIPGGVGNLKVRAVSVQPQIASKITALDTNIVLQHLELPEADKFDLIIGTNIFLYYDGFHQSLALTNISKMLRPGGLLFSNNGLLELPSSKLKWNGYTKVVYTQTASTDGDFMIWYRQAP